MTLSKKIATLFFAMFMITMVGCASTAKTEGTGEYIDDAAITTKVKASLLNEPMTKATEINVETFKGTVQLSGFVTSQASINKAIEITRGVSGVKAIKNDMRVK